MILILSTEHLEESTNAIIDWLEYYNADYVRVNGQDVNIESHLNLILDKTKTFKIGSVEIIPEKIKAVWYRRWGNMSNFEMENRLSSIANIEGLKGYMKSEYKGVSNSFFSLFSHAYWLSDPPNLRVDDKARSLILAKSIGIDTPYSFITNRKEDLKAFLEENNNTLICKSIVNTKKIKFNSQTFTMYTEEINEEKTKEIPETFFPTFFQEKIDKSFEIRAFFLDGEFSCMAIFSQLDNQTSLDFRKYNFEKPNRKVPFKLNKSLEKKLRKLMTLLHLNTGSIDIIKDKKGRYFFLEVNPVGQFGMTSIPCNYNLEKKIAKFLIKQSNTYERRIIKN